MTLPRRSRGFSLVEVMISVALLALLSLITVTGMMFHARMAQSNLAKQKMAEGARRFVEMAQIAVMDATIVKIETGPSGANTVLTIGRPDPANVGSVIYKQYAYIDADGNPATIGDNRIIERDANEPMSTSGKMLLEYCSLNGSSAVFSQVAAAALPLYQINLRVGDRTYPGNVADNAFTGRGYQSYLINAQLAKG
jgi:prepilin-type N-terminal cleavage/methylation domain-containing protein